MKALALPIALLSTLLASCGTTFPNFSGYDKDIPPMDQFPLAKAPVIIHRASIGLDTDSLYKARAVEAHRNPALIWGGYHLCTGDGIKSQRDQLLKSIGYAKDGKYRTVIILDLEECGIKRGNITVPDLASLVRLLHERTGVYPLIYVNPYQANRRLRTEEHSRKDVEILSQCPLWTSSWTYHPKEIRAVPAWQPWDLWQYSGDSGEEGFGAKNPILQLKYPRGIRGVGDKLEMNIFRGSVAELRELMASASVPTEF